MKEPERWLHSRTGPEQRLILAALAEVPSAAVRERVSARLGQAGVVLGVSGAASAATASVASTAPGMVSVSAAKTSGIVVSTFVKALLVGFGVGGVAIAGAHLTQEQRVATTSDVAAGTVRHSTGPASAPSSTAAMPVDLVPAPLEGRDDVRSRHRAIVGPAPARPTQTHEAQGGEEEPLVAQPESARADAPTSAHATVRAESAPIGTALASRDLEREVTALAAARQALKRGDAGATIREIAALDTVGGFRVLTQEAALLRVEALAISGQAEAAAALARQLLTSGVADAHRSRLEQLAHGTK